MVNPGAWGSSSGLLLGVLSGLAIAALDAVDELAEAAGTVEPAPVTLRGFGEFEDPQRRGAGL